MLAVVNDMSPGVSDMIAVKQGRRRHFTVAEQDVPLPLISVELVDFFTVGALVAGTGSPYDGCLSVSIVFLWRGKARTLSGVLVSPAAGAPDVVLPSGFLVGGEQ